MTTTRFHEQFVKEFVSEVDGSIPEAWRSDLPALQEKLAAWGYDYLCVEYDPVMARGYEVRIWAVRHPTTEDPGGLKVGQVAGPAHQWGPYAPKTPERSWKYAVQMLTQTAEQAARKVPA